MNSTIALEVIIINTDMSPVMIKIKFKVVSIENDIYSNCSINLKNKRSLNLFPEIKVIQIMMIQSMNFFSIAPLEHPNK